MILYSVIFVLFFLLGRPYKYLMKIRDTEGTDEWGVSQFMVVYDSMEEKVRWKNQMLVAIATCTAAAQAAAAAASAASSSALLDKGSLLVPNASLGSAPSSRSTSPAPRGGIPPSRTES